ncbi:hypothetical protein [Psychrobacter phage vB_PmaS_Y8A]|nr:hypothetical protein [Psychrobacter phage vB_PmaS_Y8A]
MTKRKRILRAILLAVDIAIVTYSKRRRKDKP